MDTDASRRSARETRAGGEGENTRQDRGNQRRGGSGGRSRRDGSRRSKPTYAFTDGTDRQYCQGAIHRFPEAYPSTARGGIAVARPLTIGHRPNALLLCDLLHDGPHIWPSGDPLGEDELVVPGDEPSGST